MRVTGAAQEVEHVLSMCDFPHSQSLAHTVRPSGQVPGAPEHHHPSYTRVRPTKWPKELRSISVPRTSGGEHKF